MKGKETKRRGRPPEAKSPDERAEVRSLRLEAETLAGINDVKNAMNVPTVDKALKAILDTFSMTKAKEAIPNRAAEISEFEILCRKLLDAYTHSLVLCNDAEARARDTVSQLLTSKDSTIMELQQSVTSQKEAVAKLDEKIEKLKAERDSLIAENEALKKVDHMDDAIVGKLDDMLQKRFAAMMSASAK